MDLEEMRSFLTLDTIPPELFLHVCTFLNSKYVINVLSQVCKRFKYIIEDDSTWRSRIFKKWPNKYPLVPIEDLDWKRACIEREEHYDLWKNNVDKMKKCHLKNAHFGSVNVVNIIEDGGFCVSGGRDGALKLWNILSLKEIQEPLDYLSCLVSSASRAHSSAWIWSIVYAKSNKKVYSGGFDCCIKTWDLEDLTNAITSHSLASPILCLSLSTNCLTSGCYGRSVSLFDPRANLQPVWQHIHHKKPVLCIASDDRYVISGSEDKSIIVYEKSARKVLKTIELQGFPLSMSYDGNQLLVGDVLGSFHVLDPTRDFQLVESYATGHTLKVTGIQHSLGSIITCSTDKTIRILEPNKSPEAIAVIEASSEISKISAYETTLASADTDDSITIWLPKEDYI